MTDYDWLSMPRTRTLRSSRRMAPRYPRPYTPIASRESVTRQPGLTRPPRTVTSEPTLTEPHTQQACWPLPRRLTRSNVLPLAQLRGQMSTVTEPATPNSSRNISVRRPQMGPEDDCVKRHEVALPSGIPMDSPRSNISANTASALTPKPLFHDKQRSASLGTLPKPSSIKRKQSGFYVVDSEESNIHEVRLPRSTSLCAQQTTLAPTQPLPPLPLNVAKLKSFQNIRSPTEHRGSGNSLLSGSTSILDNGGSKCFSQAETDLTSVSMISPTGLGSIGLGISNEDCSKWGSEEITRTASPIDAFRQTNVRPQLKTQKSHRASIEQSLARSSGSSGLSLSLLDRSPFRHPLNATVTKDDALRDDRTKLKPNQGRNLRDAQRQIVSPSSPLSRNSMINIYGDAKVKRSSAILQDVSGNQGSPLHDGVKSRPLSIATSDPFKWETGRTLKPGKPSAMKERAKGHKRNSCVRISNIPVYIPSPSSLQPTVEEQEEPSNKPSAIPAFTFGKPMQHQPPIRPPSRLTFDPQLTPTPKPRLTRLPQRTSLTKDSPTFSFLNLHNPSDSEPPSPFPTPTRRSILVARNSGANPNRRKPIFDVPSAPEFVYTTPEKKIPPVPSLHPTADFSLEPVIPERLQNTKDAKSEQPKPSSTLFPFPSPPHPIVPRGPRALPPTAWRRRSNSRSPTRIAKSGHSGSWTYAAQPTARTGGRRGSKDLRKSVIALRRMNSEAQEGLMIQKRSEDTANREDNGERRDGNSGESGKGHKRYLSLGDQDSEAGGECEKKNEEFEEPRNGGNRRERSETSLVFERVLSGSRIMPGFGFDGNVFGIASEMGEMHNVETPRKGRRDAEARWSAETPRSLYDENGFLKDGGRSPMKVAVPIFQ